MSKGQARKLTVVDAMDHKRLFQPWFRGSSWDGWRSVLKAMYALPMTVDETEFVGSISGGRTMPVRPVREAWLIVGRRGGKDAVASLIAAHSAAMFDQQHRVRPGERPLVLCLAVDRPQAGIVLSYIRRLFLDVPMLAAMITRETASGFELNNGVDVTVGTNSYRSVRGRPVLLAVLDECAFWRDENSAQPDTQVYAALKPALATLGGRIIGISTPHKKAGLLYAKHHDHFGRDGDVFVIRAPTRLLNPLIDQEIIDAAVLDDPKAAAAEWF